MNPDDYLGPIGLIGVSAAALGVLASALTLRHSKRLQERNARLDAIEAGEITPFDS